MTNIIGIAGAKQSGKTTSCNFLTGHELKRNNLIEDFFISEKGELVCTALFEDDKGNIRKDFGILDLFQRTDAFVEYASMYIWPIVRVFSFADKLKEICIELLGLRYDQCFGSGDDKNTVTNLRWEDMPGSTKQGEMTAREVLQYIGTEIFRKIYPNVWVDYTIKHVKSCGARLSIIQDCRFINEVEAVKEAGGKVIFLKRNIDNGDQHQSEKEIGKYKNFDAVIDNRNMSIKEFGDELLDIVTGWGYTNYLVKPKFTSAK